MLVEGDCIKERLGHQRDENDPSLGATTRVARSPSSRGELKGPGPGRRRDFLPRWALPQVCQRPDCGESRVGRIDELSPQPTPPPAASNSVEERLLLRFELALLPKDDNGLPQPAGLL